MGLVVVMAGQYCQQLPLLHTPLAFQYTHAALSPVRHRSRLPLMFLKLLLCYKVVVAITVIDSPGRITLQGQARDVLN